MGDQFSSGQTISHYKIISKIGQGGMGAVYKAEDTKLRRPVALKFLLREKFTSIDKQRFLREAQAAAALHHPNICTIYEVDEAEGEVFLAFAYLEGDTLATKIAAGPIEFDQALELGIQLADAMQEAHSHGIVHRDIKSNNIVLTPKKQAIILDFGLAQISGTSKLTQTGATLGTAAYMSPEHARGQEVDRRGDLWSLAVVIYELATGQLPFHATQDLAMLYCIVNEPHLAASEARPSLPPQFDAIMNLALAKDPDDRYQHASELAADLRSLKSLIGIETLATGAMRPLSPQRLRPTRRTILGGLAGLIAAATGFGWWYWASSDAVSGSPAPGVSAPGNPLHVAVLPLRYIGSAPGEDDKAYSDGLGEWMAGRLAVLQSGNDGLMVVTPGEVREAGISGVSDAQRIFGVGRALAGSVQREGTGWRVTLNLVDARTVRQVQSAEVRTGVADTHAALTGLVAAAAGMIGVDAGVPPGGLAGADRPLSAGGEAYIRGLGYLRTSTGLTSLRSAVEQFEQALRADPQHALALSQLATAKVRLTEIQPDPAMSVAALADAKKAVEIDAALAQSQVALGEALMLLERHPEAIPSFQQALSIDATNRQARQGLVAALAASGRDTEAEAVLLEHRRSQPLDVRAGLEIAGYYAARGRSDDAEREYLAALELTPDNQGIPIRLAGLYRRIGQLDRAKAQVERSLAMRASAEGYATLGSIEFLERRYLQAETAYEMATEMSPSSHEYWGALGDCYRLSPASDGQSRAAFGRAIELVRRDLAAAGETAEARSHLALYLAKSGQAADAQQELAAIPATGAKGATVLLRSAVVHQLAGDRSLARRQLRAAIQAGGSSIEIDGEPDLADVPR